MTADRFFPQDRQEMRRPLSNDGAGHEERAIGVDNKFCTITISRTSKTAWVAVGDYMGKRIEVVGSSASNGVRRWIAAARYKGNGWI